MKNLPILLLLLASVICLKAHDIQRRGATRGIKTQYGVQRGLLKLDGNRYVNLVVSIKDEGESDEEALELVDDITSLFIEGSSQLYNATR